MAKHVCEVCNEEFERTGRGRPPKKCPECSKPIENKVVEERVSPKERVDRLELMLKSSGLHISQHQKDYD